MNPLVVKVYDEECPACREMHAIEQKALSDYGTEFVYMELSFAALHPELYGYIETNVIDADGNVDLPIYIFYDNDKRIKGHFTGIGSVRDICGHYIPLD